MVNNKKKLPSNKAAVQAKKIKVVEPAASVLLVMGTNDCGQLGLTEDTEEQETPIPHETPDQYIQVAAGGLHTVCLTKEGRVVTFGCNDEGALGRETQGVEGAEYAPGIVPLPAETKVVKVTAGDSHSCALTDAGVAYIWGNFRCGDGALGLLEAGIPCPNPTAIGGLERVVDISSGFDHVVLLTQQNVAYSMGSADVGQLGRITMRSTKGGRYGLKRLLTPTPILLKKNQKIVKICSSAYQTFLELASGEILGCGLNNYNQVGITGDRTSIFFPEKVEVYRDRELQEICCGQHHTLALQRNGEVYAMGNKAYGRLGIGPIPNDETAQASVSSPKHIPGLQNIRKIAAGNTSSFAINDQGEVWSWGSGVGFLLGHGSEEDQFSPKKINLTNYNVKAVAAGSQHTVMIAEKK